MAFTKAEFDAVNIGDRVGAVSGPGEHPEDRAGTVKEKVEDRWGLHLVVEWPDKTWDTCHGFTKVGIGWYALAPVVKRGPNEFGPEDKVPEHLRSLTGPWPDKAGAHALTYGGGTKSGKTDAARRAAKRSKPNDE